MCGAVQVVTKEEFQRFVDVQKSGVCNMLSSQVETLAGLTHEQHMNIIEFYDRYVEVYGISVND